MKTKTKKQKKLLPLLLLAGLLIRTGSIYSQTVCTDNVNTIYGLSVSGGLYPINVNTAAVGSPIESLTDGTNPAANANAMGYNSFNGKFYYFYRCSAGSAPLSEFVSYDPATNSLQVLATPPFGTTTKIRSGCVNNSGTGYFCIDIVSSTPSLWYYDITTDAWTKITSTFMNGAIDVTSTDFKTLNSGDMAFDLAGNLWMILSSTHNYAMYRIVDPVPTTAQASVNVENLIPSTPVPVDKVGFTGLAFNANGFAFLTTSSGTTAGHNLLYQMTNIASGITYVDSLSVGGAGDDLTSCVFTYVLPVRWLSFTTEFVKQKGVQLKWDVAEDNSVKKYYVERSSNATNWERLASVPRKSYFDPSHTLYNFTDYNFLPGKTFYRIVQEDVTGKTHSSEISQIITKDQTFSISPNPAKDQLNIKQKIARATAVAIYNDRGKLILTARLNNSNESIDISKLVRGIYFLKLSVNGIETAHTNFIKL